MADSPQQRAYAAAASVVDPEIPVLTIADLGILREVHVQDDEVEAVITPTYSGCPAMPVIAQEIEAALRKAGFCKIRVKTVLTPAWTTAWLGEDARRKLREYGIAPPLPQHTCPLAHDPRPVACPHCGSDQTERLSEFGATPCKSLWRCRNCAEPFEHFKCH
jgi:ring-1,2-phenylacetyl-CoA epoxidase subunit PaaD